ncbi:MAG TPA: FG-GAP-like repeat-containing protein [Bacteroidota bacterium]
MPRIAIVALFIVVLAGSLAAQTWDVTWKMTTPPYLTLADITEMGIVKAGFDTDEDGWGEFLCAWTDLDTNAIMMFEATGDNTYQLVWSWVYPVPANTFAGIAVGDLNSNGVVDIVTTMPSQTGTDPNPPRIWAFEWNGVMGQNAYGVYNSGSGTYDPSTFWNFGVVDNYDFRPYSLTIEDIDADGQNELIVGVRQSSTGTLRQVRVVRFDGDYQGFGVWEEEYAFSQAFGGSLYSVTTGDLDDDGDREIYALIWNNFSMRIFECTGHMQYTEAFSVDQLYAPVSVDYGALDAVRVVDADNNGSPEMYIAGTEDPNKLFVVSGITDLGLMDSLDIEEFYTIPVQVNGGFRTMYVDDPDHDGNTDLMIGGEADGRIYSLEYNGSGDPADSANWTLSTVFNIWDEGAPLGLTPRLFYGHPAGDMDKDGRSEYVFVNYSPDFATWADDSPLWIIEIDVVSDVRDESAPIPSVFRLGQNYPNPFNPSTTIPYSLTERSHVRLEVFNMYGQRVALLVEGDREAGMYRASWTADVPSGTYFYRLVAQPGDGSRPFEQVRKMVLLR